MMRLIKGRQPHVDRSGMRSIRCDGTAGIVEGRFMKSTEATTNAISFSSSAPTPAARSAAWRHRRRRARARLGPREHHGRRGPRPQAGPRQVRLDALDARLAHALDARHRPHGRVAEAARVFRADEERDEVRQVEIEVHQQPELRMQIDQGVRQPGAVHEIADLGLGHTQLRPRVGFERSIRPGLDEAGFPGDVREGMSHAPTLSGSERAPAATRQALGPIGPRIVMDCR